jgi:hypothetical protein
MEMGIGQDRTPRPRQLQAVGMYPNRIPATPLMEADMAPDLVIRLVVLAKSMGPDTTRPTPLPAMDIMDKIPLLPRMLSTETVQVPILQQNPLVITKQEIAMVAPALIQMIPRTNRTGMAEVVGQAVIMAVFMTVVTPSME